MTGFAQPDVDGVTAQYPGRCAGCGGDIDVGDPIVATDDGWAHLECDAAPTAPPRVCPTCWQTLSVTGSCGCEP